MLGQSRAVAPQFDRYTILGKWASGGMATVYVARQTGTQGFDKLVGLKLLKPELVESPEFVDMFFSEACTGALLHHPNIVQTYDVGEFNNQIYMALEFINGETLGRLIRSLAKQGRTVPIPLAVSICIDVADALQYAHTLRNLQGVKLQLVHRDVSPSNIMLTHQGTVKLLDFGIAKVATAAPITKVGQVKGKLAYMSPEQGRAEDVDGRTDVFALALVLWQLLTGQRAFEQDHELLVLNAIMHEALQPPSGINTDIDPALDAIVLKGAEKDRDHRYPSAKAFADALRGYLVKTAPGFSKSDAIADLMAEHFRSRAEKLQRLISQPLGAAEELAHDPDEWLVPSISESLSVSSANPDTGVFAKDDAETSVGVKVVDPDSGRHAIDMDSQEIPAEGLTDTVPSIPSQRPLRQVVTRRGIGKLDTLPATAPVSLEPVTKTLVMVKPGGAPKGGGGATLRIALVSVLVMAVLIIGYVLISSDKHAESPQTSTPNTSASDSSAAETNASATPTATELALVSVPSGATVRINGKPAGITSDTAPLTTSVDEAPVSIYFTKKGYKGYRHTIETLNGKRRFIEAPLEQADVFGSVLLKTHPANAKVTVNGETLDAATPTTVHKLWIGKTHNIVVELAGHVPESRSVSFDDEGSRELTIKLQRAPIAYLNASCAPEPCDVFVDGNKIGVTPLDNQAVASDKEIEVQLRRGAELLHTSTLTLNAGDHKTLEVKDPAAFKHLSANISSIRASGPLKPRALKPLFAEAKAKVRQCYIDHYAEHGAFTGTLKVAYEVDREGAAGAFTMTPASKPLPCLPKILGALPYPGEQRKTTKISFKLKLSD